MAGFKKVLIDEALNAEQLRLPPYVTIGAIYLDGGVPGYNWNAVIGAVDAAGIAAAQMAVDRVRDRYPHVSFTDMFCQSC